jgi:hypothetical protein
MMAKHHIIISGTGRAGTTFLIQLFTALGLDTGFHDLTSALFGNCNAGMELDIRRPGAPYIIKSPWLCDYLDEALKDGEIIVDHAIVPVRDLFSAAQSRREVTMKTDPADFPKPVPGGLWHTDTPEQQEQVLACKLYELIYTLAKREIPLTLLYFPRIIHDPKYLYGQIAFAVKDISFERFETVFRQVVQPQLVHNFPSKTATAGESQL